MAVNFRTGRIESSNVEFQTTNLKKLNFEVFSRACFACMSEPTEFRVQFDIPSSNDYILYRRRDEALIQIRNWSNLLTLLCVSRNGSWVISSHIGGDTVDDILKEGWRQICRAKSLINKNFKKVGWHV